MGTDSVTVQSAAASSLHLAGFPSPIQANVLGNFTITALDALLRIRAHLIDPGLLLLDLFVPTQAEHPPGAPIVEVRTVIPGEGVQIGARSETVLDVDLRRLDVKTRYERRDRTAITAREDESLALTWYSEEQAVTLVRDAGYRDLRTEPLAWSRDGGRHFALAAKA